MKKDERDGGERSASVGGVKGGWKQGTKGRIKENKRERES